MIRMTFYIIETKDGLIHVQNCVMGYFGQHHVHTKKGFDQWKKRANINDENIQSLKGNICNCGLKANEVKDHDGNISYNKNF